MKPSSSKSRRQYHTLTNMPYGRPQSDSRRLVLSPTLFSPPRLSKSHAKDVQSSVGQPGRRNLKRVDAHARNLIDWNQHGHGTDSSFLQAEHPNHDYFQEEYDSVSEDSDMFATEHEEDLNNNNQKIPSSSYNKWIPAGVMRNTCYDRQSGTLLSREDCMKNLLNTFKAKKQTDFYEVLKLAESPELKGGAMQELCLSVAFCLARSGKLERSSPTTINARLEASHIFNVSDAQKCDKTVELPGGKQVRISSLIKPSMTSSWIGKTIEKSIGLSTIDILSEIRLRDEFFELYAFPDSNRHTLYPKVEAQFVDALAMCLHVGFGVKDDAWALPCLTSHIKRVCRNYICRARSVVDNIDSLLESFNNNFKMDEYFRQLELPIENSPTLNKSAMPNVHRKQDKDRIHIKTRELRGVKEEMSENR